MVYVCTDWRRHGHAERLGAPIAGLNAGGKMTADAKAERREVIANNKAWDAARPVRRQWLIGFLARRAAPKDAPVWIAATLASSAHEVRRALEDRHQTALGLLGLVGEPPWNPYSGVPHPVIDAAAKATPARATMLILGLLLGGLEASLGRDTWRYPAAAHRAYFTALQGWGYPLSDVEQLVLRPAPDLNTDSSTEPDAQPDEDATVETADDNQPTQHDPAGTA